jgi:hypothetical protein
MGAPITSAQFVKLLTEGLYEVSEDRQKFNDQISMIDKIFRVITDSTKAWEEFFSVSQVPDIQDFTGRLAMLDIFPGYSTKVEASQFGGYLEYDRTIIDDEQYGKLKDGMAGLVDSANRVREKNAVKIINNATSSAFDFISSQEEGKALAGAHTTKAVGVSVATGFNNLGTNALNDVNVSAARITMKKFKTPIGERWAGARRFGLLLPDTLEDKGKEIVETTSGLYSAEGTINVNRNRFEVIVWERMEDASTQNWALVDLDMMKKNMIFIDRIKAETESEHDFMTKAVRMSVYDRHAVGFIDWRHILFQSVS